MRRLAVVAAAAISLAVPAVSAPAPAEAQTCREAAALAELYLGLKNPSACISKNTRLRLACIRGFQTHCLDRRML